MGMDSVGCLISTSNTQHNDDLYEINRNPGYMIRCARIVYVENNVIRLVENLDSR